MLILLKWSIIKHKNLLSHIKMGREILTFGDIETEKNYDGLMDKLNGCIL